jgi:superfamily II DNA or RNA helicase
MLNLFPYQEKANQDSSELTRKGFRRILHISPGGSGKTIMMAYRTSLFLSESNKKIVLFTHRDELFSQAREKMLLFNVITEPINASTSSINPNARVFVCMIETFNQRSDSQAFLDNFKDVGLVFIDEAHRTDFNKIMHHFPDALFSGWTATPISSDKKQPLNSKWDVAIEVAKVSELQRLNLDNPKIGVVPSDCYNLSTIDRDRLKKKGDEFDEKLMSKDFSDKKQLYNTIENYFSHGKGMKGLCFNCDITHNYDMHNEFLAAGVKSRMLHSDRKKWFGAPSAELAKNWRKDCLLWLKKTPGAILNNVGILTTGFDEPSIELIMVNHATMSISRYIQEIVRGARPYQYPNGEWKEFYRLLDFGQNSKKFGNGNQDLPWIDWFNNPDLPSIREGVGGVKTCPQCCNIRPVGERFCQGLKEDFLYQEFNVCGYMFPLTEKEEDLIPRGMEKFFDDGIDVAGMIVVYEQRGWNISGIYYKVIELVCNIAKVRFGVGYLLTEQLDFILDVAYRKIKELGKKTGKRCWREGVKNNLIPKLRENGFILDVEEIGDESLLSELKNGY